MAIRETIEILQLSHRYCSSAPTKHRYFMNLSSLDNYTLLFKQLHSMELSNKSLEVGGYHHLKLHKTTPLTLVIKAPHSPLFASKPSKS